MKKYFIILITGFFLAVPFIASAGMIGTGTLNVSWDYPAYAGYYLDYDATVSNSNLAGINSKSLEDIFCVSKDDANNIENVAFLSIDPSLANLIGADNYEKISKAAWIADNYDTPQYGVGEGNAQIAIWGVTGVVTPINANYPNAVTLANDAGSYTNYSTNNWALAISGTYPGSQLEIPDGSSFSYGDCNYQDYLVPMTKSVPEPAPMILLGSGLIGLAGLGRRKFLKS